MLADTERTLQQHRAAVTTSNITGICGHVRHTVRQEGDSW